MKTIQIIYPEGIGEEEGEELLKKALGVPEVEVNESFDDPVITEIAQEMISTYNVIYADLIGEVQDLLDLDIL